MSDKCAYPKCGKELVHTPGRRKKKYCCSACKVLDWQRLNPVKKQPKTKRIPIEKWNEIQGKIKEYSNTGVMQMNEHEHTDVKETEVAATNPAPRNKEELMLLCPAHIKGIDKTIWYEENKHLINR